MNILISTKDNKFNSNNQMPTKREIDLYNYIDKFVVNSLMTSVGNELENVLSSIQDSQREKIADFKQALKSFYNPKKKKLYHICKFSNAIQAEGETLQFFYQKY